MTKLDYEKEKFDKIKQAIEEECKEGKKKVQELLSGEMRLPAEGWADIVEKPFEYKINEIQLMCVGKYERQKTWYEQFMLRFENNDTMFVYIDIAGGKNEGNK